MLGNVLSSPVIEKLRPAFLSKLRDDAHGTLLHDICATSRYDKVQYKNKTKKAPLPPEVRTLLESKLRDLGRVTRKRMLQDGVLHQPSISWQGTKLSTTSKSLGDSQVIFRTLDSHSDYSAGRICDIFMWPRVDGVGDEELEPFFVVNTLRPLSPADQELDYYSLFDYGGKLFYSEYVAQPVVLQMHEILCHFAGTTHRSDSFAEQCLHVLPLDK